MSVLRVSISQDKKLLLMTPFKAYPNLGEAIIPPRFPWETVFVDYFLVVLVLVQLYTSKE